jgi:hypothetical protein
MMSVLHPGLKLEYFRQKEWEDEWIENADNLVHEAYRACYEGSNNPITSTPNMTAESAHNDDFAVFADISVETC